MGDLYSQGLRPQGKIRQELSHPVALTREALYTLLQDTNAKNGGEYFSQIFAPNEVSLHLPDAIKSRVRATLAASREEGIMLHSTRQPLGPEVVESMLGYLTGWSPGEMLTPQQVIEKVSGLGIDPPVAYHRGNALPLLLANEVGWMDPEDLDWFMAELVGAPEWYGAVQGFFMETNPAHALRYKGLQANQMEFLQTCGIDLRRSEYARLAKMDILLEIDLRTYLYQLPDMPSLHVVRGIPQDADDAGSFEVAAPILASNKGTNPSRAVAILSTDRELVSDRN